MALNKEVVCAYLTRSDTCAMNVHIDDAPRMLSAGSSFFSDDGIGAEFEGFVATTLVLKTKRVNHANHKLT